ncbi:hypothetical protein Tco_0635379 [Tanacetum coccineum]
MKYPQHYLTEMQEVILFYNGLEVPTRQILDSKGAIPTKTAANAKVAIQEKVEYSQKWNNGKSRTKSIKTFDRLAAIQAQLNNLGREIKKVNEKMTTLAEHIIVAGAKNRPLMLEKSMYDSWASRICLFIKGKKNDRMMLDSIDNGPLVYPTVEENRQTRPKKYSELTKEQQLQDDCDAQVKNIILHGLSPNVYALVNHQEATKDIWDRVKLLIKGTELSYQEHECRLYNLFDKFASFQGETLYEYY